MKILFIVPYPTEGASNRVRIEQFIPYLKSKGMECRIQPFVNKRFFRILYLPHHFCEKLFWFILCSVNRILDIARAAGHDLIVIHREAYPFGRPYFESILNKMKKPIVFDFDDAIFLANTSGHNVYIERFKNPGKIAQILKMSKRIIAGNEYLLQYACRYNKNAIMIPSSVDTERYRPVHMNKAGKDEVVIGWVGSETTKIFLYPLEDTFQELEKRYKNIIFKIVGASFYSSRVKNVVNKNWRLEDEVLDLQSFDIGIMPMPDDEWTRGKCGFKAILYMACGIPVVASPVGVNTDIVEDGISGFFAKSTEEWVEKISVLIEDKALRESMGMRGREKIMAEYSLASNAPLFYETLKQAIDAKGAA